MKTKLLILALMLAAVSSVAAMNYRGIVYDVGLQFNPGQYSVECFNEPLVRYDMKTIADSLHCNAVRIEGEDLGRLQRASEIAAENELKVFFNPWWMNADAADVIPYMGEAAKVAERLRHKGIDITFVAGCEFTLFNRGILDGNSVNERLASMMKLQKIADNPRKLKAAADEITMKLNRTLAAVVKAVRENFNGPVTYSAGTWESVAWTMFDVIGVDYYRDSQSDEKYLEGIQKYMGYRKPVWVMEVGCCAYEGASQLGGSGFTVLQGVDKDGNGIYAGGNVPVRSEKEQADYAENQIRLLSGSGVEGMFVYLFSFPISPYRENGIDSDMTAYPIVKSFPADDPRSSHMPPWQPKEAFHRVASIYGGL